ETVDPSSPNVVLLSAAGSPQHYYEGDAWGADTGKDTTVPGPDTVWKAQSNSPLTVSTPVTLSYNNGKGLVFTRTLAIDDNFMFTVTDAVAKSASEPVTLYPYGLVSRLG